MKKTIAVLLLLGLLLVPVARALAWNQETHKQINYEAIKIFDRRFPQEKKFQLGPIGTGYQEKYTGIAVTSSSLFQDFSAGGLMENYNIAEKNGTMPLWIIYGGDWADEPHLYASVRHFYDPLKVSGQHYLTDQSWAHGQYDSPQIDALTWGLSHGDNPFSFRQALTYYKQAMEIPESAEVHWPFQDHFKINLPLTPKDLKDLRGMYLAMAYRALGESMHMLGDMTQPAHTRNDSHPMDEPIESNIFSADVERYSSEPVDEQIGQILASAQGQLLAPRELFHQVALFTNQNFYSADTIYDESQGIQPQNWETPYPSPQFKDLQCEAFTVSTFQGEKAAYKLTADLAGSTVPMAQSRLSLHWFEPAPERLQKIAELALGEFHIPPSFAKEQGKVLLPVATHACADMIYQFFPTLELVAQYEEPILQETDAQGKRIIAIDAEMVHRQELDFAWQENGLEIKYSGPGQLVFEQNGKIIQTRELHFLNGKVEKIQSHEGGMVVAPLRVYVKDKKTELSEAEDYYAAEVGTTIYLEIQAGSRTFKSAPYTVAKQAVNLRLEPTIAVGEPDAYFDFKALVSPDDNYRYDWDFGDGFTVADGGPEQGHIYNQEGNFTVTVKLYDDKGELLAEDSSSAAVADEGLLNRLQSNVYMSAYLGYDSHPENIRTDYLIDMYFLQPVWSGNNFSYHHVHDEGQYFREIRLSGSVNEETRTLSLDYELYDENVWQEASQSAYNKDYLRFSLRDLPYLEKYSDDYGKTFDWFAAEISPEYITDYERWKESLSSAMGLERWDKTLDFTIIGEIRIQFVSE